jgi:type I restriction enzyme S subunit
MNTKPYLLGELCRMVKGISPTLKTPPGPYPLVVTAEFRRTADTWQLEGPAVCIPLVSSTGHGDAALHRVHYQDGKFALANLLVALLPKDPSVCNARYLYHLLMTRKDELLVPLMQGTANVSLKEQDIASAEISLPPLTQQQRIVARIDDLSVPIGEAVALREKARIECLEIVRSVERRFWPIESVENAPTLSEVTSFLARGRQSEQGESDHYLIKTQHVQQDYYVPSALRLAPHIAAKVLLEAIAQDGDILIACSAAGCLGRVARFKEDGRTASTDTHIAIARANPDIIEPDYLYAYLRGAMGQYQLRSRERGDWKREKISFRLTELNLSDLKMVPVPVPSRKEQLRIVNELNELESEVEKLKRLQAETAAELDALLPSVLSKAFAGEL